MTVMNSAVPAAPASCCTVPTIALPCEYSCGRSEPETGREQRGEQQGQPHAQRMCAASTHQSGCVSVSVVKDQSTALTRTDPVISSAVGPIRS